MMGRRLLFGSIEDYPEQGAMIVNVLFKGPGGGLERRSGVLDADARDAILTALAEVGQEDDAE